VNRIGCLFLYGDQDFGIEMDDADLDLRMTGPS
jgi:hypothetical protein